jgi:hypothetical protein
VNWNVYDYNNEIASNDKELAILNQWKDWIIDANAKVMAAPEEERQKVAEKLNADNADMIKEVDKILQSSKAQKVLRGKELMIRMGQEAFVLDSIGADQIIKDVWLSRLVYSLIDETHTAVLPIVIDTLKALVKNHFGIERIEKANNYYFAIENHTITGWYFGESQWNYPFIVEKTLPLVYGYYDEFYDGTEITIAPYWVGNWDVATITFNGNGGEGSMDPLPFNNSSG